MKTTERYSDARLLLTPEVHNRIRNAKVLVFGAGGIGCELLKNLVMVGFENIHVVDMDTVDVSNLNRQFLFRTSDVGKPKSQVASAKVRVFNPKANVKFYHQNLFDFNLEFYEQFDICINGLDNIEARKQVNRMCLLVGNLPMIDGGTQGYDGQVMTTHRGRTECYECQPKNPPKSYPVCTIRSNPSKLVHCVVWGKHLFNRLFGVKDEETEFLKEISEIMADEEKMESKVEKMFLKLFNDQITKLIELKKDKKWDRGTPIPLKIPPPTTMEQTSNIDEMDEQAIPDLPLLIHSFYQTLSSLFRKCSDNPLKFDKDDDESMKFVFAVSNLRAMNFRIPVKSYFDVKAIAGSIIPAIATSNAIIAGLQIFEAIKILSKPTRTEQLHAGGGDGGDGTEADPTNEQFPLNEERSSYLRRVPSTYRRKWKCLILGTTHAQPNSNCYICQSNEMCIRLYLQEMSIGTFVDQVLKKELGMKDPWIVFEGKGIYESSMGEDDDEEMEGENKDVPKFDMTEYEKKKMSDFEITHGSMINTMCNELEKLDWKITFIDQQRFEKEAIKDEDDEEEEEEDKVNKETWYKVSSKQQGEQEMKDDGEKKMRDEDDDNSSDSSDVVIFTGIVGGDDDEDEDDFKEEEEKERKRKRDDDDDDAVVDEDGKSENERKKRKIQQQEEEENNEDDDVIIIN